jgi:hypothetical protein
MFEEESPPSTTENVKRREDNRKLRLFMMNVGIYALACYF